MVWAIFANSGTDSKASFVYRDAQLWPKVNLGNARLHQIPNIGMSKKIRTMRDQRSGGRCREVCYRVTIEAGRPIRFAPK